MLEELYNAYKNTKIDMCVRMRLLVKIEEFEIYDYMNRVNVKFTLLADMLHYSIHFTDNTNVIILILDLISKEMNVYNAIYVKERYTCCFTYALLSDLRLERHSKGKCNIELHKNETHKTR